MSTQRERKLLGFVPTKFDVFILVKAEEKRERRRQKTRNLKERKA